MTTTRAKYMIYMLKTNTIVIKQQLDSLSDADLLLQPEARGNCANWILGHIINGRNSIIKRLGGETFWGDEEANMYQYNTEPITNADDPHLPMAQLLEQLDLGQARIVACLETITDEALDETVRDESTLGDMVNFLIWHESYHTGQFEYLRQLTGVNDKVI